MRSKLQHYTRCTITALALASWNPYSLRMHSTRMHYAQSPCTSMQHLSRLHAARPLPTLGRTPAAARETIRAAEAEAVASTSGSHDVPSGKVARFTSRKQLVKPVREVQRALSEYMALPASQYSVLDARKIERIDDSTFKCYVGKLAFLGFSIEPVITVSVVVEDRGCTIKLLSAKLQGSRTVEEVNNRFTAQMTNIVRWSATADPAIKDLSSETSIEVVVQVPAWAGLIPVPSIEATGSKVMQTTLNLMVPRFLEQLNKDYQLWAAGDESRKPLEDGAL